MNVSKKLLTCAKRFNRSKRTFYNRFLNIFAINYSQRINAEKAKSVSTTAKTKHLMTDIFCNGAIHNADTSQIYPPRTVLPILRIPPVQELIKP